MNLSYYVLSLPFLHSFRKFWWVLSSFDLFPAAGSEVGTR